MPKKQVLEFVIFFLEVEANLLNKGMFNAASFARRQHEKYARYLWGGEKWMDMLDLFLITFVAFFIGYYTRGVLRRGEK